ncbi:helix-turn-helix transcriptional regulator [Serratia sp. M24T3]|uniref:helix-turn-helix domain-containing protein n=1 Tax=Serratia sp. M24T3 TaxID=932213 RepID=UPI00025B9105|nr:helix-turn-helix transcriptional regulator [Serratia sp. M24T3]EIC84648.1 transcriptional regulator, Nlp [Serratia sp. M24T3]
MLLRRTDWHHADIIASLHKQRTTLAALSRSAGLSSSTLANALSRPWPKGEWIIANALKLHPAEIWPSRYYHPETDELLERKMRCKLPDNLGREKVPTKNIILPENSIVKSKNADNADKKGM